MASVQVKSDIVIVGGGPGGYVAAIHAAKLGKQVTLIEQAQLGGVCLHRGCIPSKALISAAQLYTRMKTADVMGIHAENIELRFPDMQKWKNLIVEQLHSGIGSLMKNHRIQVVEGKARFSSPSEVVVTNSVGSKVYPFQDCIIATGSRPASLPHIPLDGEYVLSSTEALSLQEIPKRLVVIGAGYIGVELGTAYRKLGSHVTMIEAGEAILPGIDPAISTIIHRKLTQLQVEVFTKSKVVKTEVNHHEVHLEFEMSTKTGVETKKLTVDRVLVAVGRAPNTEALNLQHVGVQLDQRGFILVNKKLQTSVQHIYAIGDVAGEPLLAHKASYQGKIAAEVIAGDLSAEMDYMTMPFVIFSDPEVAMVGYTADQAKKLGYEIEIGKYPFQANGRALTLNEKEGFVQIISDKVKATILGVQMVGPEVSDLIAESGLAIEMGANLTDLANTIHAHPTLSEIIMDAASSIKYR
jgi:dihydrolipoamide dehydrogenase